MKMDGTQCPNKCYQSESGRCFNHKKCATLTPCKAGCGLFTGSITGYCSCTRKISSVLSKMKLEEERDNLIMGYWMTNKLFNDSKINLEEERKNLLIGYWMTNKLIKN
jgi:hypothetical protein